MQTDFLTPINLAVDPFTIGADGAVTTPDSQQLINPNRTAMLIDEFRVNIGPVTIKADPHEFASVVCKLFYGSTPLTNDFIPLLSFMPTYFNYSADCSLTWHLPRPLYVPPDVQIGVSLKRKNPFPGVWDGEFNVNQLWGFGVNGRSMPAGMDIPEKIFVPWACATSVYSVGLPFVSSDADISNPFDVPLEIDYFTGFNMAEDNAVSRSPLTFQATLSNGKVMVRDPTPFLALFPADRPILRSRALLQPKEFVSVLMDITQPSTNLPENLVFTTVGMTGWREMQTPQGARP